MKFLSTTLGSLTSFIDYKSFYISKIHFFWQLKFEGYTKTGTKCPYRFYYNFVTWFRRISVAYCQSLRGKILRKTYQIPNFLKLHPDSMVQRIQLRNVHSFTPVPNLFALVYFFLRSRWQSWVNTETLWWIRLFGHHTSLVDFPCFLLTDLFLKFINVWIRVDFSRTGGMTPLNQNWDRSRHIFSMSFLFILFANIAHWKN